MRGPRPQVSLVKGLIEWSFARRLMFWTGPAAKPSVAITLDDGPNEPYTTRVLDLLAVHKAKATFFVLGQAVLQHPGLVTQIVAGGHEVGVHGFDHSRRGLPAQMSRTVDLLNGLGVHTAFVRPPRGRLTAGLLLWAARRRMPVCLWSLDVEDSLRHEGKTRRTPRLDALAAGDIVLAHDDNPICLEELPVILSLARDRRLTPTTVSRMFLA